MSRSRLNGVDRTQAPQDPTEFTLQIPRPDGSREFISPEAFLRMQPRVAKAVYGMTDPDYAEWLLRAERMQKGPPQGRWAPAGRR